MLPATCCYFFFFLSLKIQKLHTSTASSFLLLLLGLSLFGAQKSPPFVLISQHILGPELSYLPYFSYCAELNCVSETYTILQ